MIHITKTGQLIIRDNKHMKLMQIAAEKYLWDKLDKHIVTGPLDDILKQIENQTHINKLTATIIN